MNFVSRKMESSSSTYSMSLHFEEKVSDLERKLSHTNQTLRTKEHILHLQQDQIKKMEGMYKKCLDDIANVTCEHKKTLNDLENLRIILKSYESHHHTQRNFECQVDLTSHLETNQNQKENQLQKINEILEDQSLKSDQIIELLQNTGADKIDCIQEYIEELQKISQTLLDTTEQRSNQVLATRSMMFPIIEEAECAFSAKYKMMDYTKCENTMCLVIENASQTKQEMKDASFNLPETVSSSTMQATISSSSRGTLTKRPNQEHKMICCDIVEYTSISEQTTIFDDLFNIKVQLNEVEMKMVVSEEIYNNQKDFYDAFDEVVGYVNRKETEVAELRGNVVSLNAVIERNSLLTINQIRDLCKDVTMRTGEEYASMMLKVENFREENEMLSVEIKNLKTNHSEIPRLIVELINQEVQTFGGPNVPSTDDYRQKIASLSMELEHAYETINFMRNKIDYHDLNGNALQELKSLCLVLNSETAELHNYHLFNLREKYEDKVKMLETQLQDLQQEIDKVNCSEMKTTSTQIYGWAPMKEQIDTLRNENEELINEVKKLKKDVECEISNKTSMDELKIMCLKLGQNMNESTTIKEENILLKQQLDDAIESGHFELEKLQTNYYDIISNAREEIHKLRSENKELSEGIEELKMVVHLNGQLEQIQVLPIDFNRAKIESDTCETSDPISSNECIECTTNQLLLVPSDLNYVRADVTHINQSTSDHVKMLTPTNSDLDELKSICKDLSNKLKHKKNSNLIDEKYELLASLENDLSILMKEFLDFKWTTQSESQRMVMKQTELSTQNEELINCLNQYKTVNESLLKSHYELEQAKTVASIEHQTLLENYMKIQEKLHLKHSIECTTNTILSGRDLSDGNAIKCENIEVHRQNLKLKQEVDNLLKQLNEQHKFCLMKLQESVNEKTCEQCVTTLQTLHTLNLDFKRVSNENTTLKSKLHELDSLLSDMGMKHAELTRDIIDYNKIKEDLNNLQIVRQKLQVQNDDLLKDRQNVQMELKSVNAEKGVLAHQLELTNSHCKRITHELDEVKEQVKGKEAEIGKYQDEVVFLQNAIAKVGNMHEKCANLENEADALRTELDAKNAMIKCNDSLMHEYRRLEDQLKSITIIKENIEQDFESYIRTNNLLQQTMTKQNESLGGDVEALTEENKRLHEQIEELHFTQNTSRTELIRVADECKNYKCQLEDMGKRIDQHLLEHLDYKAEVEVVKKTLQNEITSLRQMLEMQYINMDASEVLSYNSSTCGEKHLQELKTFINTKEMEIDYLMDLKLKAMAVIGKLYFPEKNEEGTSSTKNKSTKEKEQLKLRVNYKKAAVKEGKRMGTHQFHPSVQPPRSASVPRTKNRFSKESTKRVNTSTNSEPSSSRTPLSHSRKPLSGGHTPPRKKTF